ncbi:hypothetical protein LCGC14_0355330 [marine sediment metagenome]|uniref:Uncharacterized protein n=1 Tax=marine sediment metagenome TaxID=412755 RepID=A0A0F9WHU5_9ZZZZ
MTAAIAVIALICGLVALAGYIGDRIGYHLL